MQRPSLTNRVASGIDLLAQYLEIETETNDSDLLRHTTEDEKADIFRAVRYLANLSTWKSGIKWVKAQRRMDKIHLVGEDE